MYLSCVITSVHSGQFLFKLLSSVLSFGHQVFSVLTSDGYKKRIYCEIASDHNDMKVTTIGLLKNTKCLC